MDIKVGKVAPTAMPTGKGSRQSGTAVEARLLAVRPSRSGRPGAVAAALSAEEQRRRGSPKADPPASRVLTLLVSDPSDIPDDIGRGRYRVVVRFIKQS